MRSLAFLLAGLVSGISSGALGVGGAAVATPLVRFLGLSPYLAVGTPVAMILPSSVTGAWTYFREGLVERRAVVWTAPAAAVFAFAGASSTRLFEGSALMIASAAMLFILALRVLPESSTPPLRVLPESSTPGPPVTAEAGRLRYAALGAVTGFASGLLGVGGGFLMVPAFVRGFRMPTKAALGTSLAIIALTVVPNLVGHARAGNIAWKPALLLSAGAIPGARLGAVLAIRAPDRALRILIASTLSAVALAYAGTELSKILS